MNSVKRKRLWDQFDVLMKTWDAIEDEAGALFEETHAWLFNPGMKPEIIENEDTIRREKNINNKRRNICEAIERKMVELFPPKTPTPPKQEVLIGGTPEVKWQDNG